MRNTERRSKKTLKIANTYFTAIDFESAGTFQGQTDVPIQIGLASMYGTEILPDTFFSSYLSVSTPIAWSAQRVHGICHADLASAPTFLELWPELKSHLTSSWLVAHGAGTEKRFLRVFPAHGFGPWIDTLSLTRAAWPFLKSYGLSTLAETFDLEATCRKIVSTFRWHDALSDAVASLLVLRSLIMTLDLAMHPADHLLRPNLSEYFRLRKN